VALLLCLTLATPASADDWWGRDKALHLSVSLGLGGSAYGGLWLLGDDRPAVKLALAWSLAMLPGLAKELYDDGQVGNRFSARDLLWNAVGAAVGAGILFVIDLVLKRRRVIRDTSGRVVPGPTSNYWGAPHPGQVFCP